MQAQGLSQQPRWWPSTHPARRALRKGGAEIPSFSPPPTSSEGMNSGQVKSWGWDTRSNLHSGSLPALLPVLASHPPVHLESREPQKRGHTWERSTTKNKQEAQGFYLFPPTTGMFLDGSAGGRGGGVGSPPITQRPRELLTLRQRAWAHGRTSSACPPPAPRALGRRGQPQGRSLLQLCDL